MLSRLSRFSVPRVASAPLSVRAVHSPAPLIAARASRIKLSSNRVLALAVAVGSLGFATAIAGGKEEKKEEKAAAAPAAGLNPNEYTPCKIVAKVKLNHDSYLVQVMLPQPLKEMPVSSFVMVRTTVDGKVQERPYTPVLQKDDMLLLAIKSYPKGVVSKSVTDLDAGATIEVKGPIPKLPIKKGAHNHIAMIAGGSGITPMTQILTHLQDIEDNTPVTFLLANHTPEDVWFHDLFEDMPNVKRVNIVTKGNPNSSVPHQQGRLDLPTLKKLLPPASSNPLLLVCGPPSFMEAISGPKTKDYKQGELTGILKELGYTSEQVFKF